MRLLLLGDVNSIHIKRWFDGLEGRVEELALYTLTDIAPENKEFYEGRKIFSYKAKSTGLLSKISYYSATGDLKKIIREFRPHIVNAHYVSSYGMLARRSGFRPYICSIWGSDLQEFPLKTPFGAKILRKNFTEAAAVLCISKNMMEDAQHYYDGCPIQITWGVDTAKFIPRNRRDHEGMVIGTAKALENVYGIDRLIKAFSIALKKGMKGELRIAGSGSQENELKDLCKVEGITEQVKFLGRLDQDKVIELLQGLDIFAALSRREAFGVAVLEAYACELPVVVSDARGFIETVKDNETGYIIPEGNPENAADKFLMLYQNVDMRSRLASSARRYVVEEHSWSRTVDRTINVYTKVLEDEMKVSEKINRSEQDE